MYKHSVQIMKNWIQNVQMFCTNNGTMYKVKHEPLSLPPSFSLFLSRSLDGLSKWWTPASGCRATEICSFFAARWTIECVLLLKRCVRWCVGRWASTAGCQVSWAHTAWWAPTAGLQWNIKGPAVILNGPAVIYYRIYPCEICTDLYAYMGMYACVFCAFIHVILVHMYMRICVCVHVWGGQRTKDPLN